MLATLFGGKLLNLLVVEWYIGTVAWSISTQNYTYKGDKIMTIEEFVTNCLKYGFEFELVHVERESYDEYCLHMILGNHEYFVPCYDQHRLANLWYKEILEYYVY